MRACKKSALYEPIWPRLAPLALLAPFGPVRLFFALFGQGTLSYGFAKVLCPSSVRDQLALFPFDPTTQHTPITHSRGKLFQATANLVS